MSDLKYVFDDIARIKAKKVLTNEDIDLVKSHLKEIEGIYRNYKLNVDVLCRRFEKQPEPYLFKPGDRVIYVPPFANYNINHPACERGTVHSVGPSNGVDPQTVWVVYDLEKDNEVGMLTSYSSLILDIKNC